MKMLPESVIKPSINDKPNNTKNMIIKAQYMNNGIGSNIIEAIQIQSILNRVKSNDPSIHNQTNPNHPTIINIITNKHMNLHNNNLYKTKCNSPSINHLTKGKSISKLEMENRITQIKS